jgi:hypothetical protein
MNWLIQKTEEFSTEKGKLYTYIGFHGSMKITLEVSSRDQVHWTENVVHARGAFVFIDYTAPNADKEQTVHFELEEDQVFSIRRGQNFFQIETKGRKKAFSYLSNGTFIPDSKRLRKQVTVHDQLD